ncbi:MAG TPA: DUF2071 domain-containing protein [Fimbriimonas sp.]|nr:DUF2071 domain-containing protein [Fimbriimonas sp.]
MLTMRGHIDPCWLFVYRAPSEALRPLLPAALELVTKDDFGFVNIVVCRLHRMRPAVIPFPLPLSYWHIAYRLYARYGSDEGLYFLRSDADSPLVSLAGNWLTSFQFHNARVSVHQSDLGSQISVRAPSANVDAMPSAESQIELQPGSPFPNLEAAAAFLKYKPAAFSVDAGKVRVLRITRDESVWRSRLARVGKARFEYLEKICPEAELELCYEVEPIDYVWNRAEAMK